MPRTSLVEAKVVDGVLIVIFAVPADGLVAVTDAPIKLIVVIPS